MLPFRMNPRVNPADPYARLEQLRRLAAPGSGAYDNERQTALRMIERIEAELRAQGKPTSRPTPPPPPRSYSSASYEDWNPPPRTQRVYPNFLPIPALYAPMVEKDLLPRSKGGQNFYFGADSVYEFVKARFMGVMEMPQRSMCPFRHTPADGFLLLSKPGPTRDPDVVPILTGFYGDFGYGPISAGQYRTHLELGPGGLYRGRDLVFAIDAADVKALEKSGAFFQLAG